MSEREHRTGPVPPKATKEQVESLANLPDPDKVRVTGKLHRTESPEDVLREALYEAFPLQPPKTKRHEAILEALLVLVRQRDEALNAERKPEDDMPYLRRLHKLEAENAALRHEVEGYEQRARTYVESYERQQRVVDAARNWLAANDPYGPEAVALKEALDNLDNITPDSELGRLDNDSREISQVGTLQPGKYPPQVNTP